MYHAASLRHFFRTTSDAEKSNLAASYYFKTKTHSTVAAFCLNSMRKHELKYLAGLSHFAQFNTNEGFKLKSVVKISQVILVSLVLCRFFTTSDPCHNRHSNVMHFKYWL